MKKLWNIICNITRINKLELRVLELAYRNFLNSPEDYKRKVRIELARNHGCESFDYDVCDKFMKNEINKSRRGKP